MYIVMNVVEAKEGSVEDFERAFRERERLVQEAPGFVGFELLRRDRDREYIVLTKWENEETFKGWVGSELFKRSHRHADGQFAHANEVRCYDVLDVEVAA
ncbi:MAG TPA: antibiotic biosynthesis monooxygenase [Solirubrobacterales bacterium]|nr:antibiotic biosynthesis monooxygenase [Solirubrobacterales bacterium]